MMLTRKNLKGGRELGPKSFPLEEIDGRLGYKLGYCEGCNEPILIRTTDTREMLAHFHYSEEAYKKLLNDLKPKFSFKKRFIKWLVGLLGEYPIAVDNLQTT